MTLAKAMLMTFWHEQMWMCPRGCFATNEGFTGCDRHGKKIVDVVAASPAAARHPHGENVGRAPLRTVVGAVRRSWAERPLWVCPESCGISDEQEWCDRCWPTQRMKVPANGPAWVKQRDAAAMQVRSAIRKRAAEQSGEVPPGRGRL